MTNRASTFFLLIIVAIFFSFQNCSKVELVDSTFSSLGYSTVDISGKICLEQGFKLKSFFVTNASMKPHVNQLQIDADRDGLSDIFERRHGFDPNVARSRGPVLDGVCFHLTQTNNCYSLKVKCKGKENEWEFSDCDIYAMNLHLNNSPQLGLDSDGDGIPDKMEVVFELDPATDDALLDYDNDNITNIAEVLQSTHPRQSRSIKSPLVDSLFTQKVAPQETDCTGDEWVFLAKNQRAYDLGERPQESLSHNHFWIVALSERVQSSLVVARKAQYIHFKRSHRQPDESLVFSSEDFQTADNGFFRGKKHE